MSKDVYRLNVRFDLTKPQEREAVAYLNQLNEIDRKSRNRFIVEAITEQIRRRNAAYDFTLDDIRQVIQEEMQGRFVAISTDLPTEKEELSEEQRAKNNAQVLSALDMFDCAKPAIYGSEAVLQRKKEPN